MSCHLLPKELYKSRAFVSEFCTLSPMLVFIGLQTRSAEKESTRAAQDVVEVSSREVSAEAATDSDYESEGEPAPESSRQCPE